MARRITLTEARYEELSTMDDDLYDQQIHDGCITPAESAACVQRMGEDLARMEREVARLEREAADRAEVQRRMIAQDVSRRIDAEMEMWALEDDIRHAKAKSKELLIDYGVEAAKRGEDPIEAMWERRKEVAFCVELVKQGYISVDIQNGAVVATHTTVKGRKLMARIRAAKK